MLFNYSRGMVGEDGRINSLPPPPVFSSLFHLLTSIRTPNSSLLTSLNGAEPPLPTELWIKIQVEGLSVMDTGTGIWRIIEVPHLSPVTLLIHIQQALTIPCQKHLLKVDKEFTHCSFGFRGIYFVQGRRE